MRPLSAFLFASTVLLLAALPVSAQTYTAPLILDIRADPPPSASTSMALPSADASARAAYQRQRRARLLMAAGLGLLVGSSTHLAVAGANRSCGASSDERRGNVSLFTAGTLGVVGLGFAIGGGTALAASSRTRWHKPTRGQRWLAASIGLAGVAFATATSMFMWGLDTVACSS